MLIDNPPILTITIFGTGKILSPVYGLSSRRDSPETSVTPIWLSEHSLAWKWLAER